MKIKILEWKGSITPHPDRLPLSPDTLQVTQNFNDEDTQPMDFADLWKEYAVEVKPRCTCGTTKVMGPTYPVERHSDWCDLRTDASAPWRVWRD